MVYLLDEQNLTEVSAIQKKILSIESMLEAALLCH
ncbi:hypothetical protein NEOC65_001756 [Neochlamydia sp. AcF65]|nr:hypothetical protein [Neochlamydia sp. AcF65]MBS4170222.1 hypothetical protein [Neochlamydia sp. AcF95]